MAPHSSSVVRSIDNPPEPNTESESWRRSSSYAVRSIDNPPYRSLVRRKCLVSKNSPKHSGASGENSFFFLLLLS